MTVVERWHHIMGTRNFEELDELLAEDAIMYSPVVFTPQKGKYITKMYLAAAGHVIGNEHFKYVNEIIGERSACLEFETEIAGKYVNGIDLITWNEDQEITEFKVMIRPLQAVNVVWEEMGKLLEKMKS
ncbi:MAG: nuclear transport factor 2 family protein [Saprospiraceae bacterium]|nr:nuclear transport factor 2 family protein [Saprospiraceae bacterium]